MPPANMCRTCRQVYNALSNLQSHQRQTEHWEAPPPDVDAADVGVADPVSPIPIGPIRSDESMHDRLISAASSPDILRAQASTLLPLERSDDFSMPSPHVSSRPEEARSPLQDAAPYGVATNEEELRALI
ncbi:hypothetical protein FRC12_023246 [Ceratobasidium sp. 428]|nr:hypothetical protein FRC12_023246 [Ceratobasidium sp. 428]